MSVVPLSLREIFNAYKNWVSRNPQQASDYETSAKWISYFIAGRINNSHIVSELVYCLSNLLVFYNDRIINGTRHIDVPTSGDKIKLWLNVIEYSEVFLELSAKKLWGTKGKWLIVVGIQVFKCISRMVLIYHHKESIILNPPIPTLERRTLGKNSNSNYTTVADLAQGQFESVSFTLKRSGRIVRKVDSSPPVAFRNWKPVQAPQCCDNEQTIEQALIGRQLIAETIYVTKPIVHLASMACFGTNTWKPWMVALVMDLSSLHLYGTCKNTKLNTLTPKQKLQISRRTVALLLYLIRSPFYDKHSKDKINSLLNSIGKTVPLASFICGPLSQYLPFWQSNYFYMWST